MKEIIMPQVKSIGTALPEYKYSIEDVNYVANDWLGTNKDLKSRFDRFLNSSKTKSRNFILPRESMMRLNGLNGRADLFEKHGVPLGTQALFNALNSASNTPSDVKGMVFTSCSCPTIPAIDADIIQKIGISKNAVRVPIFQHGCAGGVIGLALGSRLASILGTVSVTSVELCSLVFQPENHTPAQLVGASLFADGAASALITDEPGGLSIVDSQSYLIPDSKNLMGYDLRDNGFHLRLDRELPQRLSEIAPSAVKGFLAQHNLSPGDIRYWLFHPGSIKILDFLEKSFDLDPSQASWSREILHNIGNLSSATVLFVLKSFLDSKVAKINDKILMIGIGPGLTIEMILFEWLEE